MYLRPAMLSSSVPRRQWTIRWPISPALPLKPVNSSPLRISPPPTPVPTKTPRTLPGSLGRAVGELAVGAHPHVVLDDQRPPPRGRHERLEVHVAPVEVRGELHARGAELDLPGNADAHAANLGRLDVRLLDDRLDALHDAAEDGRRAALRGGRLLRPGEELQVVVEQARQDLRPAEIDAEPVSRAHTGFPCRMVSNARTASPAGGGYCKTRSRLAQRDSGVT